MKKTTGIALGVMVILGAPYAVAQDAALIASGKAVYAENCAVCHGDNLEPIPPAADLRKLRPAQKATFNTVVLNGKAPEMPAWKGIVTEPQLEELWAFIQSSR
jgi:mono/diheme cytochrome c family protein